MIVFGPFAKKNLRELSTFQTNGPSCVIHAELYYLHVISCENNLCVWSGKDKWSHRLRFDCLGGLINKDMSEESMQNLHIQKHL